jgi:membrane protein YdbS with pleckstrin-like domain
MPFPKRLLIEGEDLVLDLRPHPIALAGPILVTVVMLAAATWLWTASVWPWWVTLALLVIVLVIYPLPQLVSWLTSIFAVTTDRVIHRQGFIAKRSMEIPLEAINDVRFEQGIIDRMVGAGSLVISSASEFGSNEFHDIRHPEEVQKTIYHQGELNKKRMYQGDQQQQQQPSASAPSATSELERLADLRAKGVLTEEEFQAQKAKLLGSS